LLTHPIRTKDNFICPISAPHEH